MNIACQPMLAMAMVMAKALAMAMLMARALAMTIDSDLTVRARQTG